MMFKLLKKIFTRGASAPVAATPRIRPTATAPSVVSRQPEAAPGVEVASLSLRAILERLPADLKAAINQMPEAEVKVILPVNAIMKQLPTGAVKMSLGSLYRQAPNGTFRKTNVEDKRMIDVPLGEIFKTINPGRLHRRSDQRQYEVPDDVQGLFGGSGTRNVAQAGTAAPPARPESTPAPAEPPKLMRMPGIAPSAPAASPAKPANGHAPASAAANGGGPEPLILTGELSLLLVEIAAAWPEGIRSELSVLTGETKVVLPVSEVSAGLQKGKVAFTWEQIRNWLTPAPASPVNVPDDAVLLLPLKIVAPAFVAATGAKKRQAVAHTVNQALPDFFGPSAGRVPTPPAAVAPTPVAPPPAVVTPPPAAKIDLPIAPAAEAPAAEPVVVPPIAEASPAGLRFSPEPVEPPRVFSSPARSAGPGPATLAELFQQPGKTEWAPNELVKCTCEMPGIIGAVVALEEGLVVAQKLPDGLSSEAFAAFMPQIFSRLDKYTGEMQLGDTEEITISTVGGPCRLFRRGKLFFAILGRSGESLPDGLHLVAAELASQNS